MRVCFSSDSRDISSATDELAFEFELGMPDGGIVAGFSVHAFTAIFIIFERVPGLSC